MAEKTYDITGSIIAYEYGELTNDETTELVRHLLGTGVACTLQGHYRKTAEALIEADFIPVDPGIAADV